jgi:hypothetical protein
LIFAGPIFLEAIARGSTFPVMLPEHIALTDPKQISDPPDQTYRFHE